MHRQALMLFLLFAPLLLQSTDVFHNVGYGSHRRRKHQEPPGLGFSHGNCSVKIFKRGRRQ